MLFDLTFAQRPSHAHDHNAARPSQQEHPKGHGTCAQSERGVQDHRHYAYRILRSVRCQLPAVHRTVDCQRFRPVHLLANPCRDSGGCRFSTFLTPRGLGTWLSNRMTNRLLPHFSLFHELPTRPRLRAALPPQGSSAQFVSEVMGSRRVLMRSSPAGVS